MRPGSASPFKDLFLMNCQLPNPPQPDYRLHVLGLAAEMAQPGLVCHLPPRAGAAAAGRGWSFSLVLAELLDASSPLASRWGACCGQCQLPCGAADTVPQPAQHRHAGAAVRFCIFMSIITVLPRCVRTVWLALLLTSRMCVPHWPDPVQLKQPQPGREAEGQFWDCGQSTGRRARPQAGA